MIVVHFGYYGPQKGDGAPSISEEGQIAITADAISKLIDDVHKK